jgi:cellobiose epimerase
MSTIRPCYLLLGLACLLPAQTDLKAYIPKLERNLKQNIIPFWLNKSIDKANGGYILSHDVKGVEQANANKGIVTQSRMVWLFSRLAREGYQPAETLAAAEHGFRFLRDRMWDKANGGFVWEVDATGAKPVQPGKHLYGQAFALYALSEYYLASQSKEALDLANALFRTIEDKAYDKEFGGYRESFKIDWSDLPPTERHDMGPSNLKLMNTHLHLMEAMTAYFRASRLPAARRRLIELIQIESNAVIRKQPVAGTDKYDRDWTPRLDGEYARVSYGHDLENVWLIVNALTAIGLPVHPFVDLFKGVWDYSLRYGYDGQNGGFYDSGGLNKAADNRTKVWWVQAEAAVSALYMFRLTGDRKYADVFVKTYDFIEKNLVDWEGGEWYWSVSGDGKPSGPKASLWKAGYHNGRAMLECLAVLRASK